jgi:hypothetical protein
LLATHGVRHKQLKLKAHLIEAVHKSNREREKENEKTAKLERENLLAVIEQRQLEVSGASLEELRHAVRQDDERILSDNYLRRQAEALKEELQSINKQREEMWSKLFLREFRSDHAKKSFLELSREVRDMIYWYLFD